MAIKTIEELRAGAPARMQGLPDDQLIAEYARVSKTDPAFLKSYFLGGQRAEEAVVSDSDVMNAGLDFVDETQGTLYGALGLGGALVGSDDVRDYGFENYQSNMDEVASRQKQATNIDYLTSGAATAGDVADAAQYFTTKGIANVGLAAAAYALGGPVTVGATAVAGLGALARKGVKEGVESVVKREFGKRAAKIAKEEAIKRTRQRVGIGITAGLAVGQSLGEVYGGAGERRIAEGGTLDDVDLTKATTAGLAAGGLEFGADLLSLGATKLLPDGTLGNVAGALMDSKSIAGRAAKGLGVGVVTEAPTEVGQTYLEELGAEGDITTPEFYAGVRQSAFAGAASGGSAVSITNALFGQQARQRTDTKITPEQRWARIQQEEIADYIAAASERNVPVGEQVRDAIDSVFGLPSSVDVDTLAGGNKTADQRAAKEAARAKKAYDDTQKSYDEMFAAPAELATNRDGDELGEVYGAVFKNQGPLVRTDSKGREYFVPLGDALFGAAQEESTNTAPEPTEVSDALDTDLTQPVDEVVDEGPEVATMDDVVAALAGAAGRITKTRRSDISAQIRLATELFGPDIAPDLVNILTGVNSKGVKTNKRAVKAALAEPSGVYSVNPETQVEYELTVGQYLNRQAAFEILARDPNADVADMMPLYVPAETAEGGTTLKPIIPGDVQSSVVANDALVNLQEIVSLDAIFDEDLIGMLGPDALKDGTPNAGAKLKVKLLRQKTDKELATYAERNKGKWFGRAAEIILAESAEVKERARNEPVFVDDASDEVQLAALGDGSVDLFANEVDERQAPEGEDVNALVKVLRTVVNGLRPKTNLRKVADVLLEADANGTITDLYRNNGASGSTDLSPAAIADVINSNGGKITANSVSKAILGIRTKIGKEEGTDVKAVLEKTKLRREDGDDTNVALDSDDPALTGLAQQDSDGAGLVPDVFDEFDDTYGYNVSGDEIGSGSAVIRDGAGGVDKMALNDVGRLTEVERNSKAVQLALNPEPGTAAADALDAVKKKNAKFWDKYTPEKQLKLLNKYLGDTDIKARGIKAQEVLTTADRLFVEQQNAMNLVQLEMLAETPAGEQVVMAYNGVANQNGLPEFSALSYSMKLMVMEHLTNDRLYDADQNVRPNNTTELVRLMRNTAATISDIVRKDQNDEASGSETAVQGDTRDGTGTPGSVQSERPADTEVGAEQAPRPAPTITAKKSRKIIDRGSAGGKTSITPSEPETSLSPMEPVDPQASLFDQTADDETARMVSDAVWKARTEGKTQMSAIADFLSELVILARTQGSLKGFNVETAKAVAKRMRALDKAGMLLDIMVHPDRSSYMSRMTDFVNVHNQIARGFSPRGTHYSVESLGEMISVVDLAGVYTDTDGGHGSDFETILHELHHATTATTIDMVIQREIIDPPIVEAWQALDRVGADIKKLVSDMRPSRWADLAPIIPGRSPESLRQWFLSAPLQNTKELVTYYQTSPIAREIIDNLDRGKRLPPEAPPQTGLIGFARRIISGLVRLMGFENPSAPDVLAGYAQTINDSNEAIQNVDADALVTQMLRSFGPNPSGQKLSPMLNASTPLSPKVQQAFKTKGILGGVQELVASSGVWSNLPHAFEKHRLGWLTMSQLADRSKSAAVKQYNEVLNSIQRASKNRQAVAHEINIHWAEAESQFPAEAKAMGTLMRTATMSQFDPSVETALTPQQKKMAAEFKALPKELRDAYVAVREHYVADYKTKTQFFADAILESEAKGRDTTELVSQLRAMRARKGPYFPLARLDDYYAVGASQELMALMDAHEETPLVGADLKRMKALRKSDKHYWVESFPTLAQAKERSEVLKERFGTSYFNEAREHFAVEAKAMPGVEQLMEYFDNRTGFDAKTTEGIRSMLTYITADLMPASSGMKQQMQRENIAGASTDMRRVFAHTAVRNAHQIGRLENARDLAAAMAEVKKMGARGNLQGGRYAAEIAKRANMVFDFEASPIVDNMMTASYFAHLGLSPSYIMINASQVPMFTMPWLTARYGFNNSRREVMRAYKESYEILKNASKEDGWRAEFNWASTFPEGSGESRMLTELLIRNLLDITIEHDLTAVASGTTGDFSRSSDFLQMMNMPVRFTEMVNRAVTGLSTYRLAMAAEANANLSEEARHQKATEEAALAVTETQFDYSGMNAARHMQSVMGSRSLAKLVFQFRKYQQGMLYLLAKNMADSFGGGDTAEAKELRSVARRTLLGLMVTSGTTAGAAGLPFVGSIGFMVNTIVNAFGEDDEPFDAGVEIRNYFTDAYGPEIATAIMKGLPNMVGVDVSKRVGLGDIASPLPFVRGGNTAKETAGEVLVGATGAFTSYAFNAVDGLTLMADGDWVKGFEKAIPVKAAQNLIRAGRYEYEGMTDRRGEKILNQDDFNGFEIFARGLGFSTTKESTYYEATNVIMNRKRAVDDTRAALIAKFAKASAGGDRAEVRDAREAVRDFNKRHPQKGTKITNKSLQSSIRRRRENAKMRDERGIKTGKQYAPYLDDARFAGG